MPPLENVKHELFAQALIENKGNQTQAYQEVYDPEHPVSARTHGARLVAKGCVRERVIDLLEKREALSLKGLRNGLERTVTNSDDRLAFEGIKFAFKLHGAVDNDSDSSNTSVHNHLHLHAEDVSRLTDDQRLAKLREFLG